MTWNVTLLFVHLLALYGATVLYRDAPCWMQKFVMAGFSLAMGICSLGHGLAIIGWYGSWWVIVGGWSLSHAAVLLLIFRLSRQTWPKPSISFPSSLT